MRNNNKILNAINRGIQLALDDYDDTEYTPKTKKIGKYKEPHNMKKFIKMMNMVVDLGLPSGTLWAKYNLGVDPNKLEYSSQWFGCYYAWGELKTKAKYSWTNYRFGEESEIKKYNYNDRLTILDKNDDAAYKSQILNLDPYNLSIPSKEQFEELKQYTTQIWEENYQHIISLSGYRFIGENGNEIFIPASGFKEGDDNWYGIGNSTELWTSELCDESNGRVFYFTKREIVVQNEERYVGLPIRPIINLE